MRLDSGDWVAIADALGRGDVGERDECHGFGGDEFVDFDVTHFIPMISIRAT